MAQATFRQRKIPFEISSPESDITREGVMQAFRALRAQARDNGDYLLERQWKDLTVEAYII